ncbi:Calcium-activated BK potassium channel alpha subunit [Popillia japonica]|uniref:Calcium-activated BK potassium channel alpha subunit n=1 Tax=Popillia japonica TaxID=7064 RepID=A0AAW1LK94_POPJA
MSRSRKEQWRCEFCRIVNRLATLIPGKLEPEIAPSLESIKTFMSRIEKQIEVCIETQNNLGKKYDRKMMEKLKQENRNTEVVIYGLAQREGELLLDIVTNIGKKLNVQLNTDDISRLYRIGRRGGAGSSDARRGGPCPVVVGFSSFKKREALLKAGKNAKIENGDICGGNASKSFKKREALLKAGKNAKIENGDICGGNASGPIRIYEMMSSYNNKLWWEARSKAKESGWKYVWFAGGKIRARKQDGDKMLIISTANDVVLRKWSLNQYMIIVVRTSNKLHVKFAEYVVCEDEFKYALLANNCTCPGASTLVTLLLHTSRGQEGQQSQEEWHRLYGRCSGNEIYHIVLGDSRFFGEYEGKSFTYASFHSHRKYGVALVGVRPSELPEFYEDTILLNPGPRHIMKKTDICYYMSITKEENSSFTVANQQTNNNNPASDPVIVTAEEKTNVPATNKDGTGPPLLILQVPTCVTVFPDNSGLCDSKQCLGDTTNDSPADVGGITGNHLDIPRTGDNPNLLSPEMINQRRNSRRPSILPVPDMFTSSSLNISQDVTDEGDESEDELEDDVPWRSPSEKIASSLSDDSGESTRPAWHDDCTRIVKGFPPVSPYIGVSPTLCYLLKEKKPLCCLQLAQVCEHCSYRNARDYQWQNKTIILAADYASNGIYNFIIPLRAHFHSKTSLNPIILLLERRPDIAFLDSISYFPLVYWMMGSIDCLDDLLRAGISLAENVVVVNKELSNSAEEDSLADCNTIVAVQTMFKFFPSIRSITELSQSSNMRFMQFRAHDKYALHLSKMEKREKERGSHISYMFRLPFAAGNVFSASMLDTLLYQAFVKDYVITFVRLLLGIDQAPGSGFLTSIKITKEDMWIRTYGRLYQKLCSTTCEIPIGIYRTTDTSVSESSHFSLNMVDEAKDNHEQRIERAEIANLVRSRMDSLNLPAVDYNDVSEKRNSLSYVIINPSCDLDLEEGDIIYLVRPSPFSAQKTFERHNSRRKSNISFCSQMFLSQLSTSVQPGSRRGSGLGLSGYQSPRAPPLVTTKSNSLSLPDSPTVTSYQRGRSNSLRIIDDILLRRSNSLRQGLTSLDGGRRKSSLEDVGLSHFSSSINYSSIPTKISLNRSIDLEITPPEESSPPTISSNTALINPLASSGMLSHAGSTHSLAQCSLTGTSNINQSLLGINVPPSSYGEPSITQQTTNLLQTPSPSTDPQHLQGTIV